MTTPLVLTRRARAAKLEKLGVEGAALVYLLSETAEERHRSRVAYATWAAEEYYLQAVALERDEVSRETLALAAGAILWADVVGVGGQGDVEGAGTARHPAFAACGKGRKHARDGSAWSAAILQAAEQCGGSFRVHSHEEGRVSFAFAIDGGSISVDETLTPLPWLFSLAREGLRRAAGLRRLPPGRLYGDDPGWHPAVSFDAPPESLPAWAQLINHLVQAAADAA